MSINQRFKEFLLSSHAKRKSIRSHSVDQNYQVDQTQLNKQTESNTINKVFGTKESKGEVMVSYK